MRVRLRGSWNRDWRGGWCRPDSHPNRHQREQLQRFGVEAVEMQALPAYEKLKSAGPVYLTFDMDVLDPAFAPGVWHREPGECWCERRLRIYMRLRERS
jgi:arginase family enzyme